jgi:Fe-S-cluster containining protein
VESGKFACSGCGLCCQLAGRMVEQAKKKIAEGENSDYIREVSEFPYPYDENGRCSQLTESNHCKVYDHRPNICSVEKSWLKHHSANYSKEDYFKLSATICNALMDEADIPKSFRINLYE